MTGACNYVGDVACRRHVLRFDMTYVVRRLPSPNVCRRPKALRAAPNHFVLFQTQHTAPPPHLTLPLVVAPTSNDRSSACKWFDDLARRAYNRITMV